MYGLMEVKYIWHYGSALEAAGRWRTRCRPTQSAGDLSTPLQNLWHLASTHQNCPPPAFRQRRFFLRRRSQNKILCRSTTGRECRCQGPGSSRAWGRWGRWNDHGVPEGRSCPLCWWTYFDLTVFVFAPPLCVSAAHLLSWKPPKGLTTRLCRPFIGYVPAYGLHQARYRSSYFSYYCRIIRWMGGCWVAKGDLGSTCAWGLCRNKMCVIPWWNLSQVFIFGTGRRIFTQKLSFNRPLRCFQVNIHI